MVMPVQKPGRSVQTYGTPWKFIHAVENRIGEKFFLDLAASDLNSKAIFFFSEEINSLKQNWAEKAKQRWCWLNPPYADISPWANKCQMESQNGARICFLVPASVGSNWFAESVHNKALVLAIRPRLTFEGQTDPYPKDCILAIYGLGQVGFDLWKWK